MSTTSIERDLEKLRIEIDQLKISYERYFLGLERQQPLRKHEELRQAVRRYRAKPPPRNTGIRFKLNSLISKFSSYDRYWDRILKEMEDGRFSRDRYNLAKKKRNEEMIATYSPDAAKRQKQRKLRAESGAVKSKASPTDGQDEPAEPLPAEPAAEGSETVTARGGKPAPRPARPAAETATTAKAVPTRRPAAGARPARPVQGGADRGKLEKTYQTFLAARKKTGESTSNMSYNKVMQQFEKKIPDFKKRHGCRDVQFKVVIKDGKAKIKAVPVK